MDWRAFLRNRRAELAGGFLVLALAVSFYSYRSYRSIPGFQETIELSREKVILTRHYQYMHDKNYPVSIQQVRLSQLGTNVIDVRDSEGRMLNFQVKGDQLLIYLRGPVDRGSHLDFRVRSVVDPVYPFFNIIQYPDGTYGFHYIAWEGYPGNKTKTIHLPPGSRLIDAEAGDLPVRYHKNTLRIRDIFSHSRKFDIRIHFSNPQGFEKAVAASPPVQQQEQVVFRVPASLYSVTPAIQGDFTSWYSRPMQREGDYYVFSSRLSPGTYRYQVRYLNMPQSDVSVLARKYNRKGESLTVLDIP